MSVLYTFRKSHLHFNEDLWCRVTRLQSRSLPWSDFGARSPVIQSSAQPRIFSGRYPYRSNLSQEWYCLSEVCWCYLNRRDGWPLRVLMTRLELLLPGFVNTILRAKKSQLKSLSSKRSCSSMSALRLPATKSHSFARSSPNLFESACSSDRYWWFSRTWSVWMRWITFHQSFSCQRDLLQSRHRSSWLDFSDWSNW